MPFNLLIFPLVGGYYFLIRNNFFHYLHQRIDRQRLIFNSAIAGIGLIFLSFLLKATWLFMSPLSANYLKSILPIQAENAGTMLLSFILGIVLAEVGNFFFKKTTALNLAISEIGNELEELFQFSVNEEELLMLTLKNDKIYIGWVSTLPIPQNTSYIRFSPTISGYRDKETKKITFTDHYLKAYSDYIEKGSEPDLRKLTHLVIKVDEILSASRFSIDVYERFNPSTKKRSK